MYINLPSRNHYRRPANYISKGYRSRRMAVDFAVPLITNVKCAKLLVEALVRQLSLDVSSIDSKSSHTTHTLPGLVNVAAFVPDVLDSSGGEYAQAMSASLMGGFTTALLLPVGDSSIISDHGALERAHARAASAAHCNYALSIAATAKNAKALDEEILTDVKYLFIPFRGEHVLKSTATVAAHFASWPVDRLIVTDAEGSNLASVLLLASLYNHPLHITGVRSKDDLLLISLSKAKQLQVTCDVAVYSLFFTSADFPDSKVLPSSEDQKVLWQNLDSIDVFSVGATPFRLASEQSQVASSASGCEETLPLLLSAVEQGRLTFEDIKRRLHDNPVKIFGLPEQISTHVEVVIGRQSTFKGRNSCWSPLLNHPIAGVLHRLVVHGQTVLLDGNFSTHPMGRDISGATIHHAKMERRASISKPDAASLVSPGLKPQDLPTHHDLAAPALPAPILFKDIKPHPTFHRRHILSVKQFTQKDLYDLFTIAHEMRLQVERSGTLDILKGKVLCTLFYEPSTRTSSSFDAAMKRCGGEVIQVNADQSSVTKGESLADTIRTLGCYADGIVIRHPDVGSAQTAAKFSPVPILNAGDGVGEHPTQVRV
jgi:carbamoyl-phosphate synthase / aspartate carbamoyltransferase